MKIQGGGKMAKKIKGEPLTKKEKATVKVIADNVKTAVIANAYSPDFKLIDDTVEEIKKSVRKNGVDHYSCNNIYILLQDALKSINFLQK